MAYCAVTFAIGNADTIFYGGPIVTVNAKNEEVEALAIQNGKIVAVGNQKAITKEWQSDNTKVIDLRGQTLMPGFVEPHVHIILTSVFEGLWSDLTNFALPYDTMDTLIQKLKIELKKVPPGGWLTGFGVDPSRTTPFMSELNADILDQVSMDVPIFIVNESGHIAYVNHKAIELSGLTDQTPNPADGGVYIKDAQGRLTGKLSEATSFQPFIPLMPIPSDAILLSAVKATMRKMARAGVTTASEMSVGANLGVDKEIAILKELTVNNAAPIRIRGYLWVLGLPANFTTVRPNEGDDRLRFIGIKYVSDGSNQGLTGALNSPYSYPKGSQNSGKLDRSDDEIMAQMKPLFDQGWQIATHANGDRAIDQTLNNYEKLLAGNPHPEERRLRIEHFTINTLDQVKKAVKLGVIPGFTIGHVDYWGSAFNNHIVGPERAERIDPAGDFKRAGSRFTLNSDSPVSPIGPLIYISEAVTRVWQTSPKKVLGPDQRVTVDDAIRAITIDAAYSIMADDKVGSLEVGKQADLVILEKNPRKTDPQYIRNIKVRETWIDGKKQNW